MMQAERQEAQSNGKAAAHSDQPRSLLAEYCRRHGLDLSEVRNGIRRRERLDALNWRSVTDRQFETKADGQVEARALRNQLAELRAELPNLIAEELQRQLVDELPEAIHYLARTREVTRNGTA